MDYIELLRVLLEDTNQEKLAEELDTSQANISRWLKGQEPRGRAMERIRLLATDRGIIDPDIMAQKSQRAELERKFIASSKKANRYAPSQTGDVANFTIHAGMGNGGTLSVTLNDDGHVINPEDSDGFWSFPEHVKAGWRGINTTYAMPVIGDSMEPTLKSGNYVFVDTSHNVPSPPDIYALDYGHGLMIKRVEIIPANAEDADKIHIISDNPHYSDFKFAVDEVSIYGRVVASFHWRG